MAERLDPKTLVTNVVTDAKALVTDNIALAKAEAPALAKDAGVGGGMFGAAGYLGANAVSLLFMAGGFGFALLLAHLAGWGPLASLALGFVLMALILLVIAGILAMMGKKKIAAAKQKAAHLQTVNEAKTSVESLKRSVRTGIAEVDADVRDRKGLAEAKRAAKDLHEAAVVRTTPATAPTVGGHGATEAPKA